MATGRLHWKILLAICIPLVVGFFVFFPVTPNAHAANLVCSNVATGNAIDPSNAKIIKVAIPIPGFTNEVVCVENVGDTNNDGQDEIVEQDRYFYVTSLSDYLVNLYQYFVGIVGILAAVMIMYAGIRWILAAGNQSRIQASKDIIFSAIIGVVIAFTSYLLLYLLNPGLVDYSRLSENLLPVTAIAQDTQWCNDVENPLIEGVPQFTFYLLSYGKYGPSSGTGTYTPGSLNYTNPDNLKCGDAAGILNTQLSYKGGDTLPLCYGQVCPNPGEVCRYNSDNQSYSCEKTFLKGTINYVGGRYVDYMKLVPVCSNGEKPGGGLQSVSLDNDVPEEAGEYIFPPVGSNNSNRDYALHMRLLMQDCLRVVENTNTLPAGKSHLYYFGGFYLDVELNDDDFGFLGYTSDDNYGVGSTCAPFNGVDWKEVKSPNDLTSDQLEALIQSDQLFKWEDFFYDPNAPSPPTPQECSGKAYDYCLLKTKTCNLSITNSAYPKR